MKNSAKIPRETRMKNWRKKVENKEDIIGYLMDFFEKNDQWMNHQVRDKILHKIIHSDPIQSKRFVLAERRLHSPAISSGISPTT